MHKNLILWAVAFAFTFVACASTHAVPGNELAFRSTGEPYHTKAWKLDTNGYVGAYLKVDQANEVTIALRAFGISSNGVAPHMVVSVGDQDRIFAVTKGAPPTTRPSISTPAHTSSESP